MLNFHHVAGFPRSHHILQKKKKEFEEIATPGWQPKVAIHVRGGGTVLLTKNQHVLCFISKLKHLFEN